MAKKSKSVDEEDDKKVSDPKQEVFVVELGNVSSKSEVERVMEEYITAAIEQEVGSVFPYPTLRKRLCATGVKQDVITAARLDAFGRVIREKFLEMREKDVSLTVKGFLTSIATNTGLKYYSYEKILQDYNKKYNLLPLGDMIKMEKYREKEQETKVEPLPTVEKPSVQATPSLNINAKVDVSIDEKRKAKAKTKKAVAKVKKVNVTTFTELTVKKLAFDLMRIGQGGRQVSFESKKELDGTINVSFEIV